MEEIILSIFNKIFDIFKKKKIESFQSLYDTKLLYEIGLEIDNEAFSQIETEITGEDNLEMRIIELTELTEIFLNILKPPEFLPSKKYKEEIEVIDLIGMANKENKHLLSFAILIIICIFFCKNKDFFISKINNLLTDNEKKVIFDIKSNYSKTLESIDNNSTEFKNINYQKEIIDSLEKEVREINKKLKIMEEAYNDIKYKYNDIELKNNSLLKELNELNTVNKELRKTIEEKNNNIAILQNELDKKKENIKESDIKINKDLDMKLNIKSTELVSNKNNDYENKYKEELKLNEELKNENEKLNDLINIMEIKMNEKMNNDIENDIDHIKVIDELEKKVKILEKEKEDLNCHFNKEFELMSSCIYNIGFQFWSLKLEDSEKIKQSENWLVRERIKL